MRVSATSITAQLAAWTAATRKTRRRFASASNWPVATAVGLTLSAGRRYATESNLPIMCHSRQINATQPWQNTGVRWAREKRVIFS